MRNARVLAGVLVVFGIIGLEFACDDSGGDGGLTGYNPNNPGGSGTIGASNVDSSLPPAQTAEAMYRALQTDLETACGGACHQTGTAAGSPPTWLAGPDSYVTIKKYVGIVVADPNLSIIVTKGQHEGPPLMTGTNAALGVRVLSWLTEEALAISEIQLPQTPPFTVTTSATGAPNSVDISMGETDADGGTALAGAKLTFNALTSGPSNDILQLKSITVVAPAAQAIRIAHPIFAIVPTTGAAVPDPVDTFSNADVSVAAGQSAVLGTGELFLFNWVAADKVKVEFNVLTKTTVTLDAGTTGGCKAVTTFTSTAEPEIKKDTCMTCHGGQNAQATAAMDLTTLGTNDNTACAQALNQVTIGNAAQSNIILAPTGGISHPYTVTDTAAFKTALTTWINAE